MKVRETALNILCLLLLAALTSCTAPGEQAAPSGANAGSVGSDTTARPADNQVPVVTVASGMMDRAIELPAELQAFRDVKLHSKLKGFVSWIGVDRGSKVAAGQVLIKLTAPEIDAQVEELGAKLAAARAGYAEALSQLEADKATQLELQAKLDSDRLTLQRLKQAAQEPGAVAQNEVDTAAKTVEGDQARINAARSKVKAAQSVVGAKQQSINAEASSLKALESTREYLTIKAPIAGTITERWVHEGDMAGVDPARSSEAHPLLRLVQTDRLRVVVSVPELEVAGTQLGEKLTFTVPAYLGKKFTGTISRIGHALDVETRTMPVEMDVDNASGQLEPGMYASVQWRVRRPYATLLVPTSSVVTTLRDTFVVRVKNGKVDVVSVKTGDTMDNRIEIVGDLQAGDTILLKGSDDYKTGASVQTRAANATDLETAGKRRSSAAGE